MQEELKSLKNPTRVLTALMFLAGFIYSIGADGLTQILPWAPHFVITALVTFSTYVITQYGTEQRIKRAEALKDQEYNEELIDDGS